MNKRLIELLENSAGVEMTEAQERSKNRLTTYLGNLDDAMLVEATKLAISMCAYRLAMNPKSAVIPTDEIVKHSLRQVIKAIDRAIDNEF